MNIVIIGASSGIGRELVLRFAGSPENRIIAAARNKNALESLSEAVKEAKIVVVPVDITDTQKSVKELKRRISEEFDTIDILINNAGYLVNKPFELHTVHDVAALVSVNFTGIASVICELLPLLARGSHVVNIGSMGGFQGSVKFPGLSYYSAAKGALAILTECLATEYAERGIAFNCLCLGAVETEMFNKAFPGYKAPVQAPDMAAFIAEFAMTGQKLFNGKIIPVAQSVP